MGKWADASNGLFTRAQLLEGRLVFEEEVARYSNPYRPRIAVTESSGPDMDGIQIGG